MTQRGILGQFRGAKDALYGPPLSLSLEQDLFQLRFEALENTGNSTEDTPAGGGYYSPEGFAFSIMLLTEAPHVLSPI